MSDFWWFRRWEVWPVLDNGRGAFLSRICRGWRLYFVACDMADEVRRQYNHPRGRIIARLASGRGAPCTVVTL